MIPTGTYLSPETRELLLRLCIKRSQKQAAFIRALIEDEIKMALDAGEITNEAATKIREAEQQ